MGPDAGKTSEKLPALLKKIAPVDIFFHDRRDVYENMVWNFRTIWPNLRKGES